LLPNCSSCMMYAAGMFDTPTQREAKNSSTHGQSPKPEHRAGPHHLNSSRVPDKWILCG
jgi:hypothetical protein